MINSLPTCLQGIGKILDQIRAYLVTQYIIAEKSSLEIDPSAFVDIHSSFREAFLEAGSISGDVRLCRQRTRDLKRRHGDEDENEGTLIHIEHEDDEKSFLG